MKRQEVVGALAALAQESRLAVFRLLVKRGPEGYAAGEIAERLDIPGPTLSFHLKELVQARLVSARKESRFIYYSANFERMTGLLAYLAENCCTQGTGCEPSCSATQSETRRRSA